MASYEAIRAVGETLKTLLTDRMQSESTPWITLMRPDVEPNDEPEKDRINLFLYRVVENAALKNQDGTGNGSAPLALNLHYLLTAFAVSDQDESSAYGLLGDAMQVLHENPIVSPAMTRRKDPTLLVLSSALEDEIEQIKITLDPLSVEDMTKIWTATTKPFRLSVAYTVSVIQIQDSPHRAIPRIGEPPFAGPRIHAVTLRFPRIDQVRVRRRPGGGQSEEVVSNVPFARIGDTLIVLGRALGDPKLKLGLGSADATGWVSLRGEQRLEMEIRDDSALQPGPLPLRAMMELVLGDPPVPHRGIESNTAVVLLVPRVDSVAIDATSQPKLLRMKGARLYHAGAEHLTFVGSAILDESDYDKKAPDEIVVRLPDDLSGGQLVRVRVNGAESLDFVEAVIS